MSSLETAGHEAGLANGGGRVRAYLRRFFTSWVAEDPTPAYSKLDRADGLGLVPDPVCTPRLVLPESAEVVARKRNEVAPDVARAETMAAGRAGL